MEGIVKGREVVIGIVGVVGADGVVTTLLTHLQSQSAVPLDVAKANDELSPSRRAKNPLSCENFIGFAALTEY